MRYLFFGKQHSPFDGMTSAELCGYTLKDVVMSKSKPELEPKPNPENNHFIETSNKEIEIDELEFDIDEEIRDAIESSRSRHAIRLENFFARLLTFDGYGKDRIKQMRIHPDTFVQIALQVAAFKTHNRSEKLFFFHLNQLFMSLE